MKLQSPNTSQVSWKILKHLLATGIRGPNVAKYLIHEGSFLISILRKGISKFVKKKFPRKIKDIVSLQRSSNINPAYLKVLFCLTLIYDVCL